MTVMVITVLTPCCRMVISDHPRFNPWRVPSSAAGRTGGPGVRSAFFWPLLDANAPQYQMVQVALTNFQAQYVTVWNQLFAAATITSIVPVIMLLGLQRYYVQSVAGTGLKG